MAADAAWPPDGVTQVMTGMGLFRIAFTIRSVLVSSPPGESISSRMATAPIRSAAATASSMYAALTWSMTPVIWTSATGGSLPEAPPARPARSSDASAARRSAVTRSSIGRAFAGPSARPWCGRWSPDRLGHELRPRLEPIPRARAARRRWPWPRTACRVRGPVPAVRRPRPRTRPPGARRPPGFDRRSGSPSSAKSGSQSASSSSRHSRHRPAVSGSVGPVVHPRCPPDSGARRPRSRPAGAAGDRPRHRSAP